MSDLIRIQAAIDAIQKLNIPEDMCVFEIMSHIEVAIATLPPVTPQPCEDCISRQYLLDNCVVDKVTMPYVPVIKIENAPPVTPQPKIGRWIKTPKAVMGEGYMWYCDQCEHQVYQDSSRPYPSEKFCPNCGAKMEDE